MRLARVDEVDRVRGSQAGGGRLRADVARARRRGRLYRCVRDALE